MQKSVFANKSQFVNPNTKEHSMGTTSGRFAALIASLFVLFLSACGGESRLDDTERLPTYVGGGEGSGNINIDNFVFVNFDGDGFGTGDCNGDPNCLEQIRVLGIRLGDCDDTRSDVYPGAPELCDGRDNDCDGVSDEGLLTTVYDDADGDGFGDPETERNTCNPPAGSVENGEDCNDLDRLIHPGAVDVPGNGTDENCDGREMCYVDADNDGYRFDLVIELSADDLDCSDPGEALATDPSGDCDDDDATVYPGAAEICDNADNDCDGSVDEGVTATFYRDADSDTYGSAVAVVIACSAPVGYVNRDSDCNDGIPDINPGAVEIIGNGIDENCNGGEICYTDADNDGYRPGAGISTVSSADADCNDSGEALGTESTGDCNDGNGLVNPGATEVCNGIDDDCDGSVDDGGAVCVECVTDDDCVIPVGLPDHLYTGCLSGTCADYECDGDLDGFCACPVAMVGGLCPAHINPLPNELYCDDGVDGDVDGLTDCDDPDCSGLMVCGGVECSATSACPAGQECVAGDCVPLPECSATDPCPAGQTCVEGACVTPPECVVSGDCAAGETCVSGSCEVVVVPECSATDPCPAGQECVSGECVSTLPVGTLRVVWRNNRPDAFAASAELRLYAECEDTSGRTLVTWTPFLASGSRTVSELNFITTETANLYWCKVQIISVVGGTSVDRYGTQADALGNADTVGTVSYQLGDRVVSNVAVRYVNGSYDWEFFPGVDSDGDRVCDGGAAYSGPVDGGGTGSVCAAGPDGTPNAAP